MPVGSAEIELAEIRKFSRFARVVNTGLNQINGLSRAHGHDRQSLSKRKLGTPRRLGRAIFETIRKSVIYDDPPSGWDDLLESGTDNLMLTVDKHTASIPWELAHDGDSFLLDKLQITRRITIQDYSWTAGIGTPAEQDLKDVVVVGLNHEGFPDELDFAETEAFAVAERLRHLDYHVVGDAPIVGRDATRENVMKALKNHGNQLFAFHFTGHGSGSALALSDRDLTISSLRSCLEPCGAPYLTFLNACSTGHIDRSGFVEGLASLGGNQIIASSWSIYEDAATIFADTFYGKVKAGFPVAKAMKEAREKLKRRGTYELTWRAFVAYGPEVPLIEPNP